MQFSVDFAPVRIQATDERKPVGCPQDFGHPQVDVSWAFFRRAIQLTGSQWIPTFTGTALLGGPAGTGRLAKLDFPAGLLLNQIGTELPTQRHGAECSGFLSFRPAPPGTGTLRRLGRRVYFQTLHDL